MAKIINLRLPDHIAKQVEEIAEKKALGLSTVVRMIVCEHLNDIAPATGYNQRAGTNQ